MKRCISLIIQVLAVWVACLPLGYSRAQGTFDTLTITFDELPFTVGYQLLREYHESGVWFRTDPPETQFEIWMSREAFGSTNISTYLRSPPGGALLFDFTGGASFDLVSVDLAEYGGGMGNPATVGFAGHRQDGSVVTTEFTTDGIVGSPLPDFETFHFGPEFSGLSYVEILHQPPFTSYSLDNVVVLVPEPATSALFLVGMFLFLARQFPRDE